MIGVEGKSFTITFADNWYRKGEILLAGDGTQLEVIEVYDDKKWWRRLLRFFGFKVKIFSVKVKPIK